MRVKLPRVRCRADGQEATRTDGPTLQQDSPCLAHVGWPLREAQQRLPTSQQRLRQPQGEALLAGGSTCPDGGPPRTAQGAQSRSCRTGFGPLQLPSPRLFPCRWRRRQTTACRPLAARLPESGAPARLVLETPWAALVAYGWTVEARTDCLPLAVTLAVKPVRHETLELAERWEARAWTWPGQGAGRTTHFHLIKAAP